MVYQMVSYYVPPPDVWRTDLNDGALGDVIELTGDLGTCGPCHSRPEGDIGWIAVWHPTSISYFCCETDHGHWYTLMHCWILSGWTSHHFCLIQQQCSTRFPQHGRRLGAQLIVDKVRSYSWSDPKTRSVVPILPIFEKIPSDIPVDWLGLAYSEQQTKTYSLFRFPNY